LNGMGGFSLFVLFVIVVVLFATSWLLRRGSPPDPPMTATIAAALGAGLATITGWLGGELDRFGVHGGGHLGDLDGLPRRQRRRVRREVDGRGEAPGPVHDDPDGEAGVVGVARGLQVAVGQADLLAPDAFGAEVGVLGAQALGLRQGRVGQLPQREGRELRIYPR